MLQRVIIVTDAAFFMLGIFNYSEHSLMHGRTRRHIVTGSVRGPDRPFVHVPVKNFGRQVHTGRALRLHFHINEFYRILYFDCRYCMKCRYANKYSII